MTEKSEDEHQAEEAPLTRIEIDGQLYDVTWETLTDDKLRGLAPPRSPRRSAPPNRIMRVGLRDGWICGICKWPVDPTLLWLNTIDVPARPSGRDPRYRHLDHIVPRSRGGDDGDENLHITHQHCNLHKHMGAEGLAEARRRLVAFYRWCADAEVPELHRLAKTIRAWETEVLAFHTTGLSNGPTEAVNLLIEKVRRIGHGFRSFKNYRLRLLLRCGVTWHTRPAARIRGRHPCLVA